MKFDQSPFWQAAVGLPKGVFAGQTLATVDNTVSYSQPYGQQNLGLHVGDDIALVQHHRIQLLENLKPFGAERLQWLNQTHSTIAHVIDQPLNMQLLDGDGLVTRQQGVALMMMTADCLPIVITNAQGTEVACVHAGWRGLANGIIEATVAKMQSKPSIAWIGAAISQTHFEVGEEVRDIFIAKNPDFVDGFLTQKNDKYLADLYVITRKKLQALGVVQVSGADRCTFEENESFYSYRRQAKTGRMATFVFISTKNDTLH